MSEILDTLKVAISSTRGLPDIAIFCILECYTDSMYYCT